MNIRPNTIVNIRANTIADIKPNTIVNTRPDTIVNISLNTIVNISLNTIVNISPNTIVNIRMVMSKTVMSGKCACMCHMFDVHEGHSGCSSPIEHCYKVRDRFGMKKQIKFIWWNTGTTKGPYEHTWDPINHITLSEMRHNQYST